MKEWGEELGGRGEPKVGIGQTLPVTVYRLVLKDSIEEKILALHATKRALSADFLDGTDQAGALGEEELMALIRG